MSDEIAPELLPGTTRECLDPWVYIEFNVNGDVRPCCVRPGVGNLAQSSLTEILNGEPVRALRSALLVGDLDKYCTDCRIRPVVPIASFRDTVRTTLDRLKLPEEFDSEQYLELNPDVKAAGMDPTQHFRFAGRYEGRRVGTGKVPDQRGLRFDPDQYLAANPDVAALQLDPWEHFLQVGQFEGRRLRLRDQDVLQESPALATAEVRPVPEAPEGVLAVTPELNVALRLSDADLVLAELGQGFAAAGLGGSGQSEPENAADAELKVLSHEQFQRQDGLFADIYLIEIASRHVVPSMTIKALGDDIQDLQFAPFDMQDLTDQRITAAQDHWYMSARNLTGRYKVSVITKGGAQTEFQYSFDEDPGAFLVMAEPGHARPR